MVILTYCDVCSNFLGLKDGWKMHCKAFPEGLPIGYCSKDNKECNNGIGFACFEGQEAEYREIKRCLD